MKNSKTKKILSILLAVMMVVGMIPTTAIPVSAAVSLEEISGAGTEADPKIAETFEELKSLMELHWCLLSIQNYI